MALQNGRDETVLSNARIDTEYRTSFFVGTRENGQPAHVDYSKASNPHMLFNGQSGAGKSWLIRHVMDDLCGLGMTQHVIEFHPDFEYQFFDRDGATTYITPNHIRQFDFQYATGNAGINPLKMIDTGPDSGGVYAAVNEVHETMKLWAPSMGTKQGTYLKRILRDVYAEKGIMSDDPITWREAARNSPDIVDVQSYIRSVIAAKMSGTSISIFKEVEKLKKSAIKQYKKLEDGEFDTNNRDIEEADLEDKIAELKDRNNQMIDEMIKGKDQGAYYANWDLTTLSSLSDIVDGMVESGLFTRQAIAPKQGMINVYRISKLSAEHQRVMTFLLLNRLYKSSMLTCRELNPAIPTTYIIADEGRYVADAAKHPMSPMNLIFGGSRKFGMGMLVGVQGPHQLSKDMSDNFATKFILKSDESANADAKKNFNLNATQMRALKPKQNAWYFSNEKPMLIHSYR